MPRASVGAASPCLPSGIAAVGITPYLYLYIRSAQHPPINEAAPATFDALLAVIRRAQYPPRTPLDDPDRGARPGQPGTFAGLWRIQLADYLVYFTWQWAKSVASAAGQLVCDARCSPARVFAGPLAQRQADRPAWWLLFALFLVTGPGLVHVHELQAGLQPLVRALSHGLGARGAGAGLLLCRELHCLGTLGRDGARRIWPARSGLVPAPSADWRPAAFALALASDSPELDRCIAASWTGRHVSRPTSPTTC